MRKLNHDEIDRPPLDVVKFLPRHPITVLVDNVRSVHNVGSIFRTSDGALIEQIILTGITPTPDNPQMHKTALGAQDVVPWRHEPSVPAVIHHLRNLGYVISLLELTDSPTSIPSLTRDHFPMCLVVGNELTGIDRQLIPNADFALEIPQYGAKQSLNVAVAYGIAVYDLVKILRSQP